MKIDQQIIMAGVQILIFILNVILLIVLFAKKKKTKTKEEQIILDEIIASIMPSTIKTLKTLCEQNNVLFNKKTIARSISKEIKKGGIKWQKEDQQTLS